MLILSQNRALILNLDNTECISICNKGDVYAYKNETPINKIATYDSRERAKEVLADICNCYSNYSKRYGEDSSEFAVYSMPDK